MAKQMFYLRISDTEKCRYSWLSVDREKKTEGFTRNKDLRSPVTLSEAQSIALLIPRVMRYAIIPVEKETNDDIR